MTVVTTKRVAALLGLVRAGLPVDVESDGNYEDWSIMGPAKVAIAGELFEAIMSSPPPDHRFRAEVLSRSLAEHVIAFAWLAVPEGDREQRIRRMVRAEFELRSRASNQLADQIRGKAEYEELFETGRVPRELLEEGTLERLEQLRADAIVAPPGVFDMALEADRYWISRREILGRNPFALVYFLLFTGPSFITHTSITAISRFVEGQPPNLVVGRQRISTSSESPYGQSLLAFVNCLLVASEVLGWPAVDDIQSALEVD